MGVRHLRLCSLSWARIGLPESRLPVCVTPTPICWRAGSRNGKSITAIRIACFLREVRPDAVVIATPNIEHKQLILDALAAGCHVICEKPPGMNYAETVEVYEAAKKAGVRHMTAFTYRFVPGMNYLRHLVKSGELGEIRYALSALE